MDVDARFRGFLAGVFLSAVFVLAIGGVAQAAPPANDDVANAQALTLPSTVTGTNVEATRESAFEGILPQSVGKTVWYTWTAGSSGRVMISPEGSDFNLVLSAWTGELNDGLLLAAGPAYTELDSDVPYRPLFFNAVAGTTYKVQVDGWGNGQINEGTINLALDTPGTISGKVSDSADVAIGEICVAAQSQQGQDRSFTETDSNGDYTITDLPPADYAVRYFPCYDNTNFFGEFHNDKQSFETADLVDVTSGSNITGIDAELRAGGRITGLVTDSLGDPLGDLCVTAFDSEENEVGSDDTNFDGEYVIPRLETGSYILRFAECSDGGEIITEYYDNVSSFEDATPVPVTVGQDTPINASVEGTGSISGTVVREETEAPLDNICVEVRSSTGSYVDDVQTDSSGFYAIEALETGNYKLEFYDCGGNFVESEFYNNKSRLLDADPVQVSPGADTSDIDAALTSQGSISGTIIDENDDPIAETCIYVLDMDGEYVASNETDENGDYTVVAVPSGQYKVQFRNCGSGDFLTEFYDDAATFGDATPVTVTSGNDTPGIDAELGTGGRITGKVTGPGGTPIQGICVYQYGPTDDEFNSGYTNSSGDYNLPALAPGEYRIQYETCGNQNFLGEFYDDVPNLADADPVQVTSGTVTANIDAELAEGGSLSGTVTDQAGDPIDIVCVNAWNSAGNFAGEGSTDSNGNYSINGLAAGDYRLEYQVCEGGGYAREFYDDKPSLETADPVSVTVGNDTSGIDAVLAPDATISGSVTDVDDLPVGEVCVNAYDSDGDYAGFDYIRNDDAGEYSVFGLTTGEYRLLFEGCGANLVSEYYDNKKTLAEANPVAASAGSETTGIDAQLEPGGSISGTLSLNPADPDTRICITTYDSSGEISGAGNVGDQGVYTVQGLAEGNHRAFFVPCSSPSPYEAEFYDNKRTLQSANPIAVVAGQVTSDIDAELTRERPPPETTIDSGPTGTIDVDQATFTFSGTPADDVATIECRLDGAAFTDCGSEETFSSLAEGPHTVEARAVNFDGNTDPTPASATFTVSLAPGPGPGPGPDPDPTAECLAARAKLKNTQTRLKKSVRLKKGAVKGKKVATRTLRKAKKSGKRTKVKKAQRKLKQKTRNVKKANLRVRKSQAAVRSAKSAVASACS